VEFLKYIFFSSQGENFDIFPEKLSWSTKITAKSHQKLLENVENVV